jgi:hypothetical protein
MARSIKTRESANGNRFRAVAPLLLATAVCLAAFGAVSSGQDEDEVDSTRAALEKWVETRSIISKEKRDWALGREMLNERIELVKHEIETLRTRIDDAEKSIAEADKKRAGLIEENEKLKEASTALESTAAAVELRTRELLKRLPDPIRNRVKPLSQRIPEKPGESKLSLAERFQNVVGILNEVNKFNGEISVASEVRALRNGTTAEVTALYVGIGQAYYVGANDTVAGVGTATAEGWTWTPANESAAEIARAVAILKNEEVAGFVQLPIWIE